MTSNQQYFTVREAADYLRKSDSQMRAHMHATDPDEHIPYITDGRTYKFKRTDLDAYMEARYSNVS